MPTASRACLHDVDIKDVSVVYIGRGAKKLGLARSRWANPFKISEQLPVDKAVESITTFCASRPC